MTCSLLSHPMKFLVFSTQFLQNPQLLTPPTINSSSNFNLFQSAHRPHHSTETALILTLDNVFHAADSGSATLLVSLDLSAAFDSIHYNILISRLYSCFGLSGTSLSWISSYLTNRTQSVKIGDACSSPSTITSGIPQGSILGPIFLLHPSVSPVCHRAPYLDPFSSHCIFHPSIK